MALRHFTKLEDWEITKAFERLQIAPTISDPPINTYVRMTDVVGEGRGYVACRNITKGTRILQDEVIFSIPGNASAKQINQAIKKLGKVEREAFGKLGNPEMDNSTRFYTYGFNMPKVGPSTHSRSGVFLHAARFNHSCMPNAFWTWNEQAGTNDKGRLTVNATRDIATGEEITFDYTMLDKFESRADRVATLEKDYGFVCSCPACDTEDPSFTRGDENRQWMKDIHKNNRKWAEGTVRTRRNEANRRRRYAQLMDTQKLLELIEIEGIGYPQQAEANGWLATWCIREIKLDGPTVMDREEARTMGLKAARNKLDLDIVAAGDRSSEVESTLNLIAQLG
ncbi:hypothetical protein G7Y79_00030g064370 [Physcia stellaris]|nr:hypothetical protein G7Y79_00030g064370 [Physcia stellaris]